MIKFINRFLRNILLFPLVIMGVLNLNTTGDTTELIPVYYDRVALKAEKPFCILEQFAVKSKDIPKYTGREVYWWKRIPLAVSVTFTGLSQEATSPTATALEFQRVKAKVHVHGKTVKVSEFTEIIAIDPELRSRAESLGEHRGKYIDMMYWEAIAKNFYPMRIDASSTYEAASSQDTTGGNESTTIVACGTTLTAHAAAGGVIVITSGNNKGMSGYLTTYSDPDITLLGGANDVPSYALNEACATGDTFKVANSTALTTANPLTCAGAAKAIVILQVNHATPFPDGYYVGVLSPFTAYDIRNDSAWVNADQYAGSKKLYNGEIGEWGGIRWVMDTIPWRSAAGTMGTYSAAEAVFHTPIFGQEAYAGVRIKGVQDKLIITPKDKTGDPLQLHSYMGWKAYVTTKVLNATWGIQILSGATSIS